MLCGVYGRAIGGFGGSCGSSDSREDAGEGARVCRSCEGDARDGTWKFGDGDGARGERSGMVGADVIAGHGHPCKILSRSIRFMGDHADYTRQAPSSDRKYHSFFGKSKTYEV